jgi:cytochrome P450
MIANALYFLLTNPETLDRASADSSLVTGVLEETLRLEPAAAVVDRCAVEDVELRGASIRQGDLVRVSLSGANRDPAVFPDPDRFDPARPNLQSHVAFAQGPHVCLGLHLARLEAQHALTQLIWRFPGLTLEETAAAYADARPRGLVFRKSEALRAIWGQQ